MFKDLDIPSIQQRCKELRLSFLFKITQGQVQAIPADAYLEPSKAKRRIAPKIFDNRETKNLVSKYVTNNSRCFKISQPRIRLDHAANPYFQEQLSTVARSQTHRQIEY